MAEPSHENIKEKVQAVREIIPGKNNNEVVMVLQYYDYSVERAIQAYLEDGAKEALQEWNFTGSKQPNKKRKNKKKGSEEKVGERSGGTPIPAANEKRGSDDGRKAGQPNGDISQTTIQNVENTTSATTATPSSSTSALTAQPLPQRQPNKRQEDSRHSYHQEQDYEYSNRERSESEVSNMSGTEDGPHRKLHQGLEKAIKDLQRQTTSLERLRHLLDHEIDRSFKSLKGVFEELRKGLNDREAHLMSEMDVLKKEASEMLEMRRGRAAELKLQLDRSDKLTDTEVSELRADIKHFVSERRHDEDLGRTTRFLYDSDHLLDEINNFGSVVHTKSMYRSTKVSAPSVASSITSLEGNQEKELSPSPEVTKLDERLQSSLTLQNSSTVNLAQNVHQSKENGPDTESSRTTYQKQEYQQSAIEADSGRDKNTSSVPYRERGSNSNKTSYNDTKNNDSYKERGNNSNYASYNDWRGNSIYTQDNNRGDCSSQTSSGSPPSNSSNFHKYHNRGQPRTFGSDSFSGSSRGGYRGTTQGPRGRSRGHHYGGRGRGYYSSERS